MAGRPKMSEADRFISHVRKDETGCWLWTAYRMPNGYGMFRTPARHELAHRASHRLFCGELDARDVMHACDNPACVNPFHLSLGTRADNMRDAKEKGRIAQGERHGRSKITETIARDIIAATEPQAELANRFGVSQAAISNIRTGVRWSHLQP